MKQQSSDFYRPGGWQPRVDVYRCADGLLVKLELAGIAEHDVKISTQKDKLIVEGKRRDWCISDNETLLSMEITYDWFKRIIPLPEAIEMSVVRTEYHNGMLLVYLTTDKDNAR